MVKIVLLFLLGCLLTFFIYCVVADEIAGNGTPDQPDKHCECVDYDCGCCTRLQVEHILDGKLCGNFSYLPDQYGVSATITYNDKAIYNETVSAKNPPPICIIHIDRIQMEICFRLYDLDVKNKCFSGCGEFEVHFFKLIPLKKLSIGCFGEDCKKSSSILDEITKTFAYLTKQHNEPQPEVVLV